MCTAADTESIQEKIYNTYSGKLDDLTDTDGDRIPDLYEMMGLVLQNGEVVYTKVGDNDSDDDGILDGDELGISEAVNINMQLVKYRPAVTDESSENAPVPESTEKSENAQDSQDVYKWKRCFNCVSNPTLVDSDGDEVLDALDLSPLEKIDPHFRVAESYDAYDYWDLLSDEKKATIEEVAPLYNTREEYDMNEYMLNFKTFITECLMGIGGQTDLAGLAITNLDIFSTYDIKQAGPAINAGRNLMHYVSKSGETVYLENFPHAIGVTRAQRQKYYDYMNLFMDMVEKTVLLDKKYTFSTTTTGSGLVVEYSRCVTNLMEFDWWFTIGSGQNAIVADVYCVEECGVKKYTAKVKFYVLDYYDWHPEKEADAYNLHLCGWAQSFVNYGIYETKITWIETSRFPFYSQTRDVDIAEVDFEGITDSNLKRQYQMGMKRYQH